MNIYESEAERLIEPFHNLDNSPYERNLTILNRVGATVVLSLSVKTDLDAMDLRRNVEPQPSSPLLRRAMRNIIFEDHSRLGEFITYGQGDAVNHYNRMFITQTPADGLYRSYEVAYHNGDGRNIRKQIRTITPEDVLAQYFRESELLANGIEPDAARKISQSETIFGSLPVSAPGPAILVGDKEVHDTWMLLRDHPFQPFP